MRTGDTTFLQAATLDSCIRYALDHQPLMRQSLIDEQIADAAIRARLADWYPQLGFNYTLQHYFNLPTSYIPNASGVKVPVTTGVINTAVPSLSLTQNIFNRDVLLASQTADELRRQAKQVTDSNRINIIVNVGKAFYDVLLSHDQVNIANADITRLERNVKDTYAQYQAGTVDKTDYKRATIALNNARALKKQYVEAVVYKLAFLKQQMNYPVQAPLLPLYDTAKVPQDIYIDTLQTLNFQNRIEFRLLETQHELLRANLKYAHLAFLPTVSAFANYNLVFQDADLYGQSFPNSYIGIQLSFPIFQGFKRIQNTRQADLQLKRLDWTTIALQNQLVTQYAQALGSYKSNLLNYYELKENVSLAEDVYNTLMLQYRNGIKAYLDVIVAENDLRTAQENYINAMYQALSSKLDVQKALGTVPFQ